MPAGWCRRRVTWIACLLALAVVVRGDALKVAAQPVPSPAANLGPSRSEAATNATRLGLALATATKGELEGTAPVDFEGTITLVVARNSSVFVEHGTAGVQVVRGYSTDGPELHRGTRVRVMGLMDGHQATARVVDARLDVLGEMALPDAPTVTGAEIASGVWNGRRVRTSAVVCEAFAGSARTLVIDVAGVHVDVEVPEVVGRERWEVVDLRDSTVSVEGVVVNELDRRGRPGRARLLVAGPECIRVLRSGLVDPAPATAPTTATAEGPGTGGAAAEGRPPGDGVGSRTPGAMAAVVMLVLAALASVWIAMLQRQVKQRRTAEEKARRSEASTRTINYFAASLLEDPDEDRILSDLARNCVAYLGFGNCTIHMMDVGRNVLAWRAGYVSGDRPSAAPAKAEGIPVGMGVIGGVAATARAEVGRDRGQPGEPSVLAVPIVARGKVLGVITSEHPGDEFFTRDHVEMLVAIASLCANKLIRVRAEGRLRDLNLDLERRIERRTGELVRANELLRCEIAERARAERIQRALFEISEAAHAVADLPSLYARIHAIIGTLMRAESFYLALLDDATGEVSFPYYRDVVDPAPAPRRGGRGMTEYVLRTGRATLASVAEIQRLRSLGEYVQSGSPAAIWLGVPLSAGGRTFGVMAVQDRTDPQAYGEEERRLLSFVAGQTALAIERKRREGELQESTRLLRESEERFGKAFHSTPAVLSIIRLTDERVLEINDAFVCALGYSREDVVGRTLSELHLWVDAGERAEFLYRVREHGFVHSFEARLQGRRGPEEIALMSADTIVLDREPCLLALSVIVTERKRAEKELVCALAHERELSELKSRFVAMVSHEFRTPLGIIASSAEILEAYGDRLSVEERRSNLGDITEATRQMSEMVEEVLLLGKVEAGKLECRRTPLHLAGICAQVVNAVRSVSGGAARISVSMPESLPPAEGDEGLLRHIFSNLVGNAVKYSPADSEVGFQLEVRDRLAVFSVRDRGIGIPETDRGHLFQAFHRGRNVGNRPGTGLGMVIVKRCVELHGGWISVESEEGQGTLFVVALPLFPGEAAAGPHRLESGAVGVTAVDAREFESA